MKSEAFFLALPVAATLLNGLVAVFFVSRCADAQPVRHLLLQQGGRCIDGTEESCPASFLQDLAGEFESASEEEEEDDDEEEPMLKKMPGYDFKAYVRADVSTFYGEEPGSRHEFEPKYNGQAFKLVSQIPEASSLYWVGDEPFINSLISPFSSGGTASYPGHEFILTKPNRPEEVLCRIRVTSGTSVYFCDPFSPNNSSDPARGDYNMDEMRSLDSLSDDERSYYDANAFNLEFGKAYKEFTGGSEWLSMYPRNRPRHKIWRADYFGQEHIVATPETHFVEIPPDNMLAGNLAISDMAKDHQLSEYREPGMLNLTLKAVSCSPRAFEVRGFLSEKEVDHILKIVNSRTLQRSMTGTTGGQESSTRTSRTTWLSRNTDPVVNAVFRRAADALRMDEALLRHRTEGELDEETEKLLKKKPINEELQVVHYDKGQQYTAHHDFSYPEAGQVDSPTRSINLCMYLNDVPAGGETSFPRWRNGETKAALNVKPEKGKAMIFFMTNPDGNLDDLTHHAALPVQEGEKYFVNLWIHDPVRN